MEEKYNKAKNIARQIADVMQSKEIKNDNMLKEWVANNPSSGSVVDVFTNESELSNAVESFDCSEKCNDSEEALKLKLKVSRRRKNQRILFYNGVVAAAMIAVSMLVWNGFQTTGVTSEMGNKIVAESIPMNVIAPTLVLNNGKEINLNDSIDDHTIVKDGEAEIRHVKAADTTLTINYNTLIIPSKYTYSVVLSDGTKVILNANSKLIYPADFGNDKREVTLEGEAFFDVTKSDIPFVVRLKGVAVRVYGTKFNVNSYDANMVETILVSGSVGVSVSGREDMLSPNQMSNIDVNSGSCIIRNIDVSEHLAWTDGRIKSYDANLGSLIKKLSSWYGINFTFVDGSKWDIPLTASFRQTQSIEEIIRAIEYVTNVKIEKMEGGYRVH